MDTDTASHVTLTHAHSEVLSGGKKEGCDVRKLEAADRKRGSPHDCLGQHIWFSYFRF